MKNQPSESWIDILFENRNKKYGAYAIRKYYHRRLISSLATTISSAFILLSIFYFTKRSAVEEIPSQQNDSLYLFDFSRIDLLVNKTASPKPAIEKSIQKKDKHAFLPVTEPVFDKTEDTTTVVGASSGVSGMTASTAVVHASGVIENRDFQKDTFSIASVDKMPDFPGGLNLFYDYLKRKIHFTNSAKRVDLSDKSYIRFVINEEGKVGDIMIMKKIGYGMDEEVIRVMQNSPKWIPGIVRNRPVKTVLILPISFSLIQ